MELSFQMIMILNLLLKMTTKHTTKITKTTNFNSILFSFYPSLMLKSRFRQLYNATMSANLYFKGFALIFYFYEMLYGNFISQFFCIYLTFLADSIYDLVLNQTTVQVSLVHRSQCNRPGSTYRSS